MRLNMNSAVEHPISTDAATIRIDKFSPTEEKSKPSVVPEFPCNNEKYKKESCRKETFTNWPSKTRIDGAKLAKAGFIYTGCNDEVVCVFCNGHVKDWKYADSAMKKHRELFPHCDFVSGKSSNMPLTSSLEQTLPFSQAETVMMPVTANSSERNFGHLPSTSDPECNGYEARVSKPNNTSVHKLPDFEKLQLKEERMKTFENSWSSPTNPDDLAKAGFFYTGKEDKVQCAFCKGIVSMWAPEDIPIVEHCKHFPRCPFIMNTSHSYSENKEWFKRNGHDICNRYDDYTTHSLPENGYHKINGVNSSNLEELGVSIHQGPYHYEQATEAARLRSFVSWPSNSPVKKEDLASAGFFYIGIGDHTKCFYCDGGLSKWEPGDDPWVEHARWFPKCTFLRLNKGDEFVASCAEKNTEQSTPVMNGCATHVSYDDSIVNQQADEIMQSSMVKAVFEAGLYPPYLVRAAVIRQIKETGGSFNNLDELCEAIATVQHEMSSQKEPSIVHNYSAPEEIPRKQNSLAPSETESSKTSPNQATSSKLRSRGSTTSKLEKNSETSIEEEYQVLKDQRLCKICMDKEVGIVFLPCGHLLTCTSCATALKDCPLCRTAIKGSVRVFMP